MIIALSRMFGYRFAAALACAWLACNVLLVTIAWAQPDPDILEAASHLDRATKLLGDANDEFSYRRTLGQRIKDLFDEGSEAVEKMRDELDRFDWANNPMKMILGAAQDALGIAFPFLAIGGAMREKHWRGKSGPAGNR